MNEERINKAVAFAMTAHREQYRKVGDIPYIWHPVEVANICMQMTHDEDVIIAGLLHDTVEDTDVTIEDIEREFGPRVREFVGSETEDKHPELPPSNSWLQRKRESVLDLLDAPLEAKIVWLADKVSNMRSFHNMYIEMGDRMWENFHMKDARMQKWYYTRILSLVTDLKDRAPYLEFQWRVNEVFKNVEDLPDEDKL